MPAEAPIQLLVVDEQQSIRRLCAAVGRAVGLHCLQAENADEALERLEAVNPELVLADDCASGLGLLAEAKRRSPQTEVALMSAVASSERVQEAVRLGAYDFVIKPFRVERLRLMLIHMAEKVRLQRENQSLRSRLQGRTAQVPCTDLMELERITMQRVLAQVEGDKERARRLLGISRATLYRKIKRYGLPTAFPADDPKSRSSRERVIAASRG